MPPHIRFYPQDSSSRRRKSGTRRRLLAWLGVLVVGGLAVLIATTSISSFGKRATGARLDRIVHSPQYRDGKFHNLVATTSVPQGTLMGTLWKFAVGAEQRTPPRPIPLERRAARDFAKPPASGLRVTWIGHASSLLELDGARILFDPVWAERVSPSSILGPKRHHPTPIALEEVPPVDAVVVSHNHYDHLDMGTVQRLAAANPKTKFFVPLGVGAHLNAWGIPDARIVELDWYQEGVVGPLTLTATPARHFCGRAGFDADENLWASWVARGPTHRVFYSGDTGASDEFARIGERYGPFDLTLIQIGTYGETWPDIHTTPEEAVAMHLSLKGKVMLPVHWMTFNLAFHRWDEPADRVVAAAEKSAIRLVIPVPGQMIEPSNPPPVKLWWR